MASPDLLFFPYKLREKHWMEYNTPFTTYYDKKYKELGCECKTCPEFSLWINKTIHGECKRKGHRRSYDKMRCHPKFRNNIKFHCYSCGKKGRHTTFLLKEIQSEKFYRVWICNNYLKSFFLHVLKSYYRWLRYYQTYPENNFKFFNELKANLKKLKINYINKD